MPEFTRMSISLPQELRARMDAVPDSINWSGVAQAAFEDKLSALAKAGEPTIASAIARLRGTSVDVTSEDYRNGLERGRLWAMNQATVEELRRLQDLFDHLEAGEGFERWLAKHRDISNRLGHHVFSGWHCAALVADKIKLFPVEADDHSVQCIEAAIELFGGKSALFKDRVISGFVNGALAFWGEVKDLI